MFFKLLTQYIVFSRKDNRFLGQQKTLKKSLSRCLFFKAWFFLQLGWHKKKRIIDYFGSLVCGG
jgi:hypothetical protein